MPPLRAAVIGAGHFGRFHAEKYAALEGVELAAVVDSHAERARAVAAPLGARALVDHRDLAGRIDLASVVVPTRHHFAVARDLIEAGAHVLVEKPLAATRDEARGLVTLAAARGRVLQVGHQERFNPAFAALRDRLRRARFIDATRIGPHGPRGTDVSVVLDLMIHDIDLVRHVVGREVERVEAHGGAVLSDTDDVAYARLYFTGGAVANLAAGRVSDRTEREMRILLPDGHATIDFQGRTAAIASRTGGTERTAFDMADTLRAAIESFVRSVRDGAPVAVTGEDGSRALETALRVIEALRDGRRGAAPAPGEGLGPLHPLS